MKKEKLNLYYLGLASLFAAKSSDARYMLASVHAEPCKNDKGAYIVATDGHRLVVYHERTGILTNRSCCQLITRNFLLLPRKNRRILGSWLL